MKLKRMKFNCYDIIYTIVKPININLNGLIKIKLVWMSISFSHECYILKEKGKITSFFTNFANFFFSKKSEKIKIKFIRKEMKLKSMWVNNTYITSIRKKKKKGKLQAVPFLPIFSQRKSGKIFRTIQHASFKLLSLSIKAWQ